jgi:hypothetical protein
VVRAILREAGIKLGTPSRTAFADRVRDVAGADPVVVPLVEPLAAPIRWGDPEVHEEGRSGSLPFPRGCVPPASGALA